MRKKNKASYLKLTFILSFFANSKYRLSLAFLCVFEGKTTQKGRNRRKKNSRILGQRYQASACACSMMKNERKRQQE